MSLEARLKQGFERATASSAAVDEALAGVLTTYRVRKRNRAILLAAAGSAAVIVWFGGDRVVGWVEGLERELPPADQSREIDDDRARAEEVALDSSEDSTRRLLPEGSVVTLPGFGGSLSSGESENSAPASGSTDAVTGGSSGQAFAGEGDESQSEDYPRYVRRKRGKWSHSPEPGNSPSVRFIVLPDETHIRVGVRSTGGGGFDLEGPGAEVYEIVDGERRLLATFCRDSELLEVAPGSEIEVRALMTECGNGFYIKGFASVRFYR